MGGIGCGGSWDGVVSVRRELRFRQRVHFCEEVASDEWRVKKPKKQKGGEAGKKVGH
jgi:hypothetical protein